MIATSTVATAFMARRALEQAVHWIYSHDSYLEAPYCATLSSLVWDDDFRDIVDSELHKQIVLLIRWGNHAAHGGEIKERGSDFSFHIICISLLILSIIVTAMNLWSVILMRSVYHFQQTSNTEKLHNL